MQLFYLRTVCDRHFSLSNRLHFLCSMLTVFYWLVYFGVRHIMRNARKRPLYNFRQADRITKTYLCNFDPLKPHFYIVKLGFTGVYIIFLFLLKNIDCGYPLEPPRRGGSNEYPQSMFWAEIWNISEIFIWKFSVFGGDIFYVFE